MENGRRRNNRKGRKQDVFEKRNRRRARGDDGHEKERAREKERSLVGERKGRSRRKRATTLVAGYMSACLLARALT